MKFKQTLWSLFGFAVLIALTTTLNAQVTIGSGEKPVDGALLDLKDSGTYSNGETATKGLGMPRVHLISITNLFPMFEKDGMGYKDAVKADEDKKHVGLWVYNTNDDLPRNLCKGLYIWDGTDWSRLADPCALNFSYTPTTPFPSTIGNYNLFVSADADWVPTIVSNPDNMLVSVNQTEQSNGMDVQYPISLAANPTFYNREALFNVTSNTVPSFGSHEMKVSQLHAMPILNITSPTNGIIDFAAQMTAQSVSFDVNSKWNFTTDANFYKVVSSPIGGYGTPQIGGTPLSVTNKTQNFTPNSATYTSGPGQVTYTTKVFFQSEEVGDAEPIKKEVTLSRRANVPILLFQQINTDVSNINFGMTTTAQSYTLKTNAGWTSSLDSNSPNVVTSVNTELGAGIPFQLAQRAVTISPSTTYVGMGKAGNTHTTILTYSTQNVKDVDGNNINLEKKIAISRQVPRAFKNESVTAQFLDFDGYQSTIIGESQEVVVEASTNTYWWANYKQTTGSEGVAGANVPDNNEANYARRSVKLTLPTAKEDWTVREFAVQACLQYTGVPNNQPTIATVRQYGYHLRFKIPASNVPGLPIQIPSGGGKFELYLQSYTGKVEPVRIVVTNVMTGDVIVRGNYYNSANIVTVGAEKNLTMEIEIPSNNTGSDRQFSIEVVSQSSNWGTLLGSSYGQAR